MPEDESGKVVEDSLSLPSSPAHDDYSYRWARQHHHHHVAKTTSTSSGQENDKDGEQQQPQQALAVSPPEPPLPVAIVDLKHLSKGHGLVATRHIRKDDVLWTETIPSIAAAMQMPDRNGSVLSSSSSQLLRRQLEPIRACQACCACLEPASAYFDNVTSDNNTNHHRLWLHLWPIKEYTLEFESVLSASHHKTPPPMEPEPEHQPAQDDPDDDTDSSSSQQFLQDDFGRVVCHSCQALYCSRTCQTAFIHDVYPDCCRYRQALNAVVHVIVVEANRNDIALDADRRGLGDYWEIFLATRIFASMITTTTRKAKATTTTTTTPTNPNVTVSLERVLDHMCGDPADMTRLRVGIPVHNKCLDDEYYSVEPFYKAISDILLPLQSHHADEDSNYYSASRFSLHDFERIVMICKQNALHMKAKSLFAMYEDTVREHATKSRKEIGEFTTTIDNSQSDAAVVMRNALAALYANGTVRHEQDDSDIEGSLGQVNCCAILALFSKLNHACDASVDVVDGSRMTTQPGSPTDGSSTGGGGGLCIDLVATRDIMPCEELSVCYLSPENARQRNETWRNERLQSNYLFTCSCSRCCLERKEGKKQ